MTKNSRKLIYLMLIVLLTMSYVAFAAPGDTFSDSGLTYEINADGITVTVVDYTGTSAVVTVPASVSDGVDTYDVTVIGSLAFNDCDTVERINLPDSLEAIEDHAFPASALLEELYFDNAPLTMDIDDEAFLGIELLNDPSTPFQAVVPHDWNSSSMTSSDGVLRYMMDNRIDFRSCWMLFDFDGSECVLSLYNNLKGYNGDSTVIIPEGVTEISDYAFEPDSGFLGATDIQYVSFPSTLLTIGTDVFWSHHNIDEMIFFGRDESFNSDAFNGCTVGTTWSNQSSNVMAFLRDESVGSNNFAVTYIRPESAGLPNHILEGDTVDWMVYLSTNFEDLSVFFAGQTVEWASDDPGIAYVDPVTGEVTGISGGVTTIRVENSDGFTHNRQITVDPLGITLDNSIFEDTEVPLEPTTATDLITYDDEILITGSTVAFAPVELLLDGLSLFPLMGTTADEFGAFSFTLNFVDYGLTEGTYSFSGEVTNGVAVTESTAIDVTYDATPPNPVVSFVDETGAQVDYFNTYSTTLRFKLESFDDLYKYQYRAYNDVLTIVEEDTDTIPFMPYIELDYSLYAEGEITVEVIAWDEAGNESMVTWDTIIKDTIAPGNLSFDILEPFLNINDTEVTFNIDETDLDWEGYGFTYGVRNMDEPTPPAQDVVQGECFADVDVMVETSVLNDNLDGDIRVALRQMDEAGNLSGYTSATIYKDMTPPSGYTVAFTHDYFNMLDATAEFEVTGVEAGATFAYTISDEDTGTPDVTGTDTADGYFTADITGLSDGTITISIVVTDEHNNVGEISDEDTLLKDTVAPVATVAWEDEEYWNASANDPYTFEIGITEVNDYTLEINLTDLIGTAVVSDSGAGTYDVAWVDVSDGDVTVDVTAEDEAGNVSSMVFDTVMKDTVAPGLVNSSIGEAWLNLADQEITLTVDKTDPDYIAEMPGVTYVYEVRNVTQLGPRDTIYGDSTEETINGDILIDTTSLFNNQCGEIRVRVALVDAAGNQGDWKVVSVMKDMIAPGYIDSTIDEDWLNLADQELTLRVDKTDPDYASETNVTYVWEARNQDQEVPRDVVAGDSSSEEMDGSVLIDTTPLNSNLSGEIGVRVALVDEAGNQGLWKWVFVNKDMIVPVVEVEWEEDTYWNNASNEPLTFMVMVTEDNPDQLVVAVLDDASNFLPYTDNMDGSYSVNRADAPENNHIIALAIATDLAGNANVRTGDSVYKDTVIPVVEVEWTDMEYWNNAADEPYEFTVTVTDDNPDQLVVAVLDEDSNYIPYTDNMDGTYSVNRADAPENQNITALAIATDIAGNANVRVADSVFKDTVIPVVEVEWEEDTYWNYDSNEPLTFTVTVTEDNPDQLVVAVLDEDSNYIPYTDNMDGSYSVNRADAPNGENITALAIATDIAGNANVRVGDTVFKDTVNPTITTSLSNRTTYSSSITFTASADDDVNLVDFNVNGASHVSGDEYRASLSYGYNTITLTAIDEAGNETVEAYSVRRRTSSTGGYIPPVIVVPPVIIEPPVVEPEPECVIDLVLNENGAMVNGEMVELSTPPILDPVTSRTLVPLRFVSEVLGAEVNWNNELKQIQILYEGTEILLTINSTTVYVNGEAQVIDVAPQLIEFTAEDGTTFFVTYVPLRFVSETMGAEVIFDPITKGITIKK